MTTDITPSPIESYWDSQSDVLKHVKSDLYDHDSYKPLSATHPLLRVHATATAKPPNTKDEKSKSKRRPPLSPQLGKIGEDKPRTISPSLRGTKYDVIPPVQPRKAFGSPVIRNYEMSNGYDSWGEGDSSSENEDYFGQPYPMVMYPMVFAPPSHITQHRSKRKGVKSQKKVRYRNTPVFLNSRENTKHNPLWLDSSKATTKDDLFDPRSNSVLARYQYPHLNRSFSPITIGKHDFSSPHHPYIHSDNQNLPRDHPYYASSFYYCEDFLDEAVPQLVLEAVQDVKSDATGNHSLRKLNEENPLADVLDSLVHDTVKREAASVVRELAQGLAREHLEKTAVFDNVSDMVEDLIQELAPAVIEDALYDNLLQDIVKEDMTAPEVAGQSNEIAVEVLTHYSNKVRDRDIKEILKTSGGRLVDSFCLDYLLANITRQGELWTEGEHANKLLDEMMLSIVITEYFNVGQKKRMTVGTKPVRRYLEKVATDVTLDTLLKDLSQNLDEDMADLDEYEQGIEDPDLQYKMPAELKKWLDEK